MITQGKHKATVEAYAVTTTSKGDPSVEVRFKLGEDSIVWRGYFTEKTIERTLETLAYLGMTTSDLDALGDPNSGALEIGKEAQLTIEPEEYNGKTRMRVKWVNPVKEFANTMGKSEASAALSMHKGRMEAVFAKLGVKPAPKPVF